MTKRKEPPPKEPDSLDKLAQFTKQILQVPRSEIRDKPDSTGPTTDAPRSDPYGDSSMETV